MYSSNAYIFKHTEMSPEGFPPSCQQGTFYGRVGNQGVRGETRREVKGNFTLYY